MSSAQSWNRCLPSVLLSTPHTHTTPSPSADGVAVKPLTSCLFRIEWSLQSPGVRGRRLKDCLCSENHPNIGLGERNQHQDCFLSHACIRQQLGVLSLMAPWNFNENQRIPSQGFSALALWAPWAGLCWGAGCPGHCSMSGSIYALYIC